MAHLLDNLESKEACRTFARHARSAGGEACVDGNGAGGRGADAGIAPRVLNARLRKFTRAEFDAPCRLSRKFIGE
ncbi:hypothetical protein ACVBGC_16590 [Burkholderia stagnalis]